MLKILGVSVQNVFARATSRWSFVHPTFFLLVKGPAADATDAPLIKMMISFFRFSV
jgi:hypothetical protein